MSSLLVKNRVYTIVYNSMFSVAALLLAYIGNLSIFPTFPFLKADLSEIPAFIAVLISGIPSGITVLLTTSIIRSLLFSSSGWIGIIMRLAPILIIASLGISKNKKLFSKLLIILIGIILCVSLKLLLNYYFWINFFNIPKSIIMSSLFTIILPYNILKPVFGLFIAFALNKKIMKYNMF